MNILKWFRKDVEEDQEPKDERLILSRRKFLFLGGAAAGAAILKVPAIVEPPTYRTYLMGKDAWMMMPMPQAGLKVFYDKQFVANLKANFPASYNVRFTVGLPPSDVQRVRVWHAPSVEAVETYLDLVGA